MSKESFKTFAKSHPELVKFIKNKEMTWQKFYEIYDIYGEDKNAWEPYINNKTNNSNTNIKDILGNIDTDSIQKHIGTAQKAISVVQELIGKKGVDSASSVAKSVLSPRPINKFFED